jgi:hypothetical protein
MKNMTPFLLMLSVLLSRQLHLPQSVICSNKALGTSGPPGSETACRRPGHQTAPGTRMVCEVDL